jgi:hypothetical protein
MSALTSMGWKPATRTAAAVHAMPFPDSAEVSRMRRSVFALRDILIVLAIQLVFRATLLMRRWNY